MRYRDRLPLLLRISYWFDNKMAEGLWPKVKLLLTVTIIFILVVGTIAAIEVGFNNLGDSYLQTIMYTLGYGDALTIDTGATSPLFFVMMLITILYCMFFSATLIGLINNALSSKVEELGKGLSRVLEEGHTLILGFNETTLVLLEELIEANRNQRTPQVVAILGSVEREEMNEILRRRIGRPIDHPETEIICRTGVSYSFDDLRRCALAKSRTVIVNAETDFETVKAVMACSHILSLDNEEHKPYIIAVTHSDGSSAEAAVAAKNAGLADQLEFISLNEALARIMVHTSRQAGLSHVFTELFNYTGCEFYLIREDASFPGLYGRTVEEINRMLKTAYAVGVAKGGEDMVIGDPRATRFEEGDALITVMEDDDALVVAKEPIGVRECTAGTVAVKNEVDVLVLGVKPILDAVLTEYGEYLAAGSSVHVADSMEKGLAFAKHATLEALKDKGIEIVYHQVDIEDRLTLDNLLDETGAECVLVLAGNEAGSVEPSDERVMKTLIYLREYRKTVDRPISITCEIGDGMNRDLAAATGPDDFIIGDHISALLMAQISQERSMAAVLDAVLSSGGFEIYMKKASWYVTPGEPVDLISVSSAVAQRGEIFIGIHQQKDGQYAEAVVNPSKLAADMATPRTYVFGENDHFVVLAENGRYED